MATWPNTLPPPLVDGYAVSPVDPCIRTDMETGASRTRRRTRARNDVVDAAFIFSDAQYAIFRTWFDDDAGAAGGAAWFFIALPLGDGGNTAAEARFKSVWKAARSGRAWKITTQMEIR